MSVHQESLTGNAGGAHQTDEAPELEYAVVEQDSLMMFGAAMGGAVLGTLMTLLILVIINNGTLRFGVTDNGETLTNIQEFAVAVNGNVHANSQNIEKLNSEFNHIATSLASELALQNIEIDDLATALSTLDLTRRQFDHFMTALSEAMATMEREAGGGDTTDEESSNETASAEANSGAPTDESANPIAVAEIDVAVGTAKVILFTDANGNGIMDGDEAYQPGLNAHLLNEDGEVVSEQTTSDNDAILFDELAVGHYLVQVTDDAENMLLEGVEFSIAEDDEVGQVVMIAVTE